MQSNAVGRRGEGIARVWLEARGMECLAANWRPQSDGPVRLRGEIDLVMRDGDAVAFVEVKTRRYGANASAYEAVSAKKQALLTEAALAYMRAGGLMGARVRFDVAVVVGGADGEYTVEYYKNAFLPRKGRYFV